MKRSFMHFEPQKLIVTGPGTTRQNRPKSCDGQLRVHPAAPMVLQGGPKVQKWFPKISPRC
jgi:hypothetical protein